MSATVAAHPPAAGDGARAARPSPAHPRVLWSGAICAGLEVPLLLSLVSAVASVLVALLSIAFVVAFVVAPVAVLVLTLCGL